MFKKKVDTCDVAQILIFGLQIFTNSALNLRQKIEFIGEPSWRIHPAKDHLLTQKDIYLM